MKNHILIVGSGHVGISLAIDLSLSGHAVTLAPLAEHKIALLTQFFQAKIDLIDPLNTINHRYYGGDIGVTQFQRIPSLQHYDVMFVCVPDIYAVRQPILKRVNRECNASLVVHVRGGPAGLLHTLDTLDAGHADTTHVLVEDAFYNTRVDVPQRRITVKRKRQTRVSLVRGHARTLDQLRACFRVPLLSWFPSLQPAEHRDLLFCPHGFTLHSGVNLAEQNLQKTLAGVSYNHYIDGIDEALGEQIERLDALRVSVAHAYGANTLPFKDILHQQYGVKAEATLYLTLQHCRDLYTSMSPSDLNALKASRYISEDLPALYVFDYLIRCQGDHNTLLASYLANLEQKCHRLGIDLLPLKHYQRQLIQRGYTQSDILTLLER